MGQYWSCVLALLSKMVVWLQKYLWAKHRFFGQLDQRFSLGYLKTLEDVVSARRSIAKTEKVPRLESEYYTWSSHKVRISSFLLLYFPGRCTILVRRSIGFFVPAIIESNISSRFLFFFWKTASSFNEVRLPNIFDSDLIGRTGPCFSNLPKKNETFLHSVIESKKKLKWK